MERQKLIFHETVDRKNIGTLCDYLAAKTGLSKTKIKDAMNKGAVWVRSRQQKRRRIRKATFIPRAGDRIEMYYDAALLSRIPPKASCLADRREYSVWYKPSGLMAQGNNYGDHCSLLRQAELFAGSRRKAYLVHRLDREAAGLMLIAHTKEAAAELSKRFAAGRIIKYYRANVRGDIRKMGKTGILNDPLDKKAALTEYEQVGYDPEEDVSDLSIIIKTGRRHQIRRHLAGAGFPVMGDPAYGSGNKNSAGLQLVAVELTFDCPKDRRLTTFRLEWESDSPGLVIITP